MAYSTDSMTTAVGQMIVVFDTYLVASDNWSIFDAAAGTNAKVYRCLDAGASVDFYMLVDDNVGTSYATIELWQGWNATTHVGIGVSLTTINATTMRIMKTASSYGICVSDHRLIFWNFTDFCGTYIGQLERFDTSKNMPIFIGTAVTTYNPLGHYNATANGMFAALYDENANVGNTLNPYLYQNTYMYLKTIATTYWIPDYPIINTVTGKLMGTLEGVGGYSYNVASGLTQGDLITVSGIEWVALSGSNASWCMVKKA